MYGKVPRYWRVKGKSASPRTMAPCSIRTACLKLFQSKTENGEVTAKTTIATASATTTNPAIRAKLGPGVDVLERWACHPIKRPATTGAARIGRALNFEPIARPAPTPVTIDHRTDRSSHIRNAPYNASTVKVVLMGSTAKKWLSWICNTVKAEKAAASNPTHQRPLRRP